MGVGTKLLAADAIGAGDMMGVAGIGIVTDVDAAVGGVEDTTDSAPVAVLISVDVATKSAVEVEITLVEIPSVGVLRMGVSSVVVGTVRVVEEEIS